MLKSQNAHHEAGLWICGWITSGCFQNDRLWLGLSLIYWLTVHNRLALIIQQTLSCRALHRHRTLLAKASQTLCAGGQTHPWTADWWEEKPANADLTSSAGCRPVLHNTANGGGILLSRTGVKHGLEWAPACIVLVERVVLTVHRHGL